jgi:hypothetical protein
LGCRLKQRIGITGLEINRIDKDETKRVINRERKERKERKRRKETSRKENKQIQIRIT